ncbi:MAG: DNA polymerase IV [Bdellovibrionales bacterium]|nr:DNA polymerase IV [Bdellovibrionales bacterium]
MRKIIHVDMDAFYASVEQRDNPELHGKPVAVGGSPDGRGVVAAASYEARPFGVRSAMSAREAKNRCPHLLFVKPRIDVYRRISRVVMAILREHTDLVEPLSLDEAFLDVTVNKRALPYATAVAKNIREKIKSTTGLNASAGVAPNKFLAKIASEMAKPNGLKVIRPEEVQELLPGLAVRAIPGVGPKMERKMADLGIQTVKHLQEFPEAALVEFFGKQGSHLFELARGVDDRVVAPERERKSVSVEHTYDEDIKGWTIAVEKCKQLAAELEGRLLKRNLGGHTVTLKATYGDFTKITRSCSGESLKFGREDLLSTALELLKATEIETRAVRLLGLGVSGIDHIRPDSSVSGEQLVLF